MKLTKNQTNLSNTKPSQLFRSKNIYCCIYAKRFWSENESKIITQKLVKSEVKIKQSLLESGTKISLFGAQRYRNDSDNFESTFFRHIQFHRHKRLRYG